MAKTTYAALQTITVGAGGSTSIDFTVPIGYTDLLIKYNVRSTTASATAQMAIDINGNQTASNYFWLVPFSNGSTVSSSVSPSNQVIADITASTSTADVFTSGEIYISDYLETKTKQITSFSGQENNNATAYIELSAQTFRQTAAITAIRLRGTTFAQYSTFTLYGILSTDATATGTGTTPYVDFLLVAGGAGGGYGSGTNNGGGGGGGGGILAGRYNTVASSSYTVTVGAGGSYGGNSTTEGQNGFTTSFGNGTYGTISATGGGGGGSGFSGGAYANGVNGASGGGAAYVGTSKSGGSALPVGQGRAGGANSTAFQSSGGGGGASVAGGAPTQNGSSDPVGGTGGNGLAFTITGSSVTYSGGGGGGSFQGANQTGGGGSGGTGGGGRGGTYYAGNQVLAGLSGTANTGGGGGGGYTGPTNIGSGGSGVVVLRYPVGYNAAASTTGSPTVTTDSTYRYYKFTGTGSITF